MPFPANEPNFDDLNNELSPRFSLGGFIMMGEQSTIQDRASCLDCGRSLSRLQQMSGARFCGDGCRVRYAVLPVHEVCTICGRRLTPQQFGERLCHDLECRRQFKEQVRERERLRIEVLRQEARRLRDSEAEALGVAQPDRYPPEVIPAIRRRLVPVEKPRVRMFRDHLARLITEASGRLNGLSAVTAARQAVQPSPGVAAVTGHACALCQGWCCRTGGNHAYLTADGLHQYMVEHPEQDPPEVLRRYLLHLGDESVEGSCIYHQDKGCGLPRELRSDTCNRFHCPELTEYRERASNQDQAPGFFVAVIDNEIVAAAFIDEDGTRRVSGTADAPSDRPPEAL